MNKKNKTIGGAIVVIVLVAGASFYTGMSYAKGSSRPAVGMSGGQFTPGQAGARGTGRTGARMGGSSTGAGATAGEVLAKDDKSITIKLAAGGSKIVFITPTTPVSKDAIGSLADVQVGTQVIVAGSANADGSVSAQSIRIGGVMLRGGPAPTTMPTPAQ